MLVYVQTEKKSYTIFYDFFKIMGMERKLKDIQTEIEKEKNRNMPQRTASSIKYHQYRLFRSSLVPETTPHVVVTSNPEASLGATGESRAWRDVN